MNVNSQDPSAHLNQPARRTKKWPTPEKLLLSAYIVLTIVFLMTPILIVVFVSFTSSSFIAFPIKSYSLRWYVRIWEYRPFLDSMIVSGELAVASALLGTILGVPAALVVGRINSPLATTISVFLLAPISTPAVVLGFAMLYYLSALSLGTSFLALLIAHTVIAIPYISRTVLSVYRALGPDLEEAGAVLGASRWSVLWHITLPLIRPGVFAGAVFALLISLDNLPISFFFGSASTNTLPVVMLSYMQNQFDPSIAAVATVQTLISMAILLIVNRMVRLTQFNSV